MLRSQESAWLIEWPANRQMPVRYWHPTEGHVVDPAHAVRFCRREDAEAMLKREHLFGGAKAVEHIWTQLAPIDPREDDPSREGIFRSHNCWKCDHGARPCVRGAPNRCEYPRARND